MSLAYATKSEKDLVSDKNKVNFEHFTLRTLRTSDSSDVGATKLLSVIDSSGFIGMVKKGIVLPKHW